VVEQGDQERHADVAAAHAAVTGSFVETGQATPAPTPAAAGTVVLGQGRTAASAASVLVFVIVLVFGVVIVIVIVSGVFVHDYQDISR
jgi:hypothetical protein